MGLSFFLNSILLGAGLAMDAFSVSCANGLREPNMKAGRMVKIAGVYAFFQFAMPMAGWFCVHQLLTFFRAFQPFIPWIALGLLGWIGGKMLIEGIRNKTPEEGVSIGFTISDYHALKACLCALIIAAVTEGICIAGLALGKRVGMKLSSRASVLGGVILIAIGLEVFISGIR